MKNVYLIIVRILLFVVGLTCEDIKDDCSPSPCNASHSDFCVDLLNDYYCQCHVGYRGKNCDVGQRERERERREREREINFLLQSKLSLHHVLKK